MKVKHSYRLLGLLTAAALTLAACKGQEAESATPTTPPAVAIGAENVGEIAICGSPVLSGATQPGG